MFECGTVLLVAVTTAVRWVWASISTSTTPSARGVPLSRTLASGIRTPPSDRRASPALCDPGTPAMTCTDSAQCLSVIVTHRRRLTAWRRHDLGAGVRGEPQLGGWSGLSTCHPAGHGGRAVDATRPRPPPDHPGNGHRRRRPRPSAETNLGLIPAYRPARPPCTWPPAPAGGYVRVDLGDVLAVSPDFSMLSDVRRPGDGPKCRSCLSFSRVV